MTIELPMTMPQYRAPFTLEKMQPFLTGRLTWPHLQEKFLEDLVCVLVVCRMRSSYQGKIMMPETKKIIDAQYFLNKTQAGAYEGTAFVIMGTYTSGGPWARGAWVAICNHIRTIASTAKPHIGWRPAKCLKCGLDMTVDSGD